jgi:hypothetical protein
VVNARKAGWPTWFVSVSLVVHLAGQRTGVTYSKRKRQPAHVFEARRRYYLKSAIYAAMADAARIVEIILCPIRVLLTGKEDSTPAHLFLTRSAIASS